MEPNMQTNVLKALLAARQEFAPVVKAKINPHFKSRYADLEAVLDAVSPALAKAGLVLVQRTQVAEGGSVLLITDLVHAETGERLSATYPLIPARANDPQALGGCLTYARRYSALALLGIAAEDDDGQQASKPAAKTTTPAQQATRPANPTQPTTAEPSDAELEAAIRMVHATKTRDEATALWKDTPEKIRKRIAPTFIAHVEKIGGKK